MSDGGASVLSIDLGALAANHRLLQKQSGCAVAGVVKADAYGLGMAQVAPVLEQAGADCFFVATIDEGVALRAVTARPIYVLGGLHAGKATDFAAHDLTPILNSLADIAAWTSGPCALHFDTGMNRLGLGADETLLLMDDPTRLAHLDVRLVMSHYACSDDVAHPMNAQQDAKFAAIYNTFRHHLPQARWSMANSSGIFRGGALYDVARPGYAVYGGNPTPETENPMQPVVRLEARVLQTRRVAAGDTIGYSASHTFIEAGETATLCLGYADGFLRSFSNRGRVYWQGQSCPILGRVSMDLVTIGIGHLGRKPAVGDMVEVLGPPHQTIDDAAAVAGTIGYEILTSLGMRYQRRYIQAS